MTSYSNNGNTKSKKRVYVNDNGIEDQYIKESIIENGIEKIIDEEGNKNLESKQIEFPKFKFIDDFYSPWYLPMSVSQNQSTNNLPQETVQTKENNKEDIKKENNKQQEKTDNSSKITSTGKINKTDNVIKKSLNKNNKNNKNDANIDQKKK